MYLIITVACFFSNTSFYFYILWIIIPGFALVRIFNVIKIHVFRAFLFNDSFRISRLQFFFRCGNCVGFKSRRWHGANIIWYWRRLSQGTSFQGYMGTRHIICQKEQIFGKIDTEAKYFFFQNCLKIHPYSSWIHMEFWTPWKNYIWFDPIP